MAKLASPQWKNINESYKNLEGYKRVAWPPAGEERVVREFTPQPQTQYQSVPSYNQQPQQESQQPQYQSSAVPSAQAPIYNNVHHHHNQPHSTPYNNVTTTNNHARESISPYNPRQQNENHFESFPPQTPETPIVLVDKQFSRQASHEPSMQSNGGSSVAYQPEWQQMRQQQYEQPQNQTPTYNQQSQFYQQQYQQPSQQHQQPQKPQYQYQPPQPQQQQQQQKYHPQQQQYGGHQQQQQPQYQPQHQETPGGWKPAPAKDEFAYNKPAGLGNDVPATSAYPIFQKQYQPNQQQDNYQQPPPQQQQQQYQPPQQQPNQYSPQPQYQAQAPSQNQYQPQCQQPQQQYQQPPWVQQQHLPQPYKPPTQQGQYQAPQQQQQYQAPSSFQQPNYQAPLNNQYQAPSHNQQQYQAPSQNQFVSQPNQQQPFNSYSQPQNVQNVSHNSNDQPDHLVQHHDQRGASPGIITLRKETPISQAPAPVYTSQPAAVSFKGGNQLRGDLKWPPPEYKEAAARENEERRLLALGPVCRPRKVHRDYTPFFAKNALSHHYPSYKVPPGTQHMTY